MSDIDACLDPTPPFIDVLQVGIDTYISYEAASEIAQRRLFSTPWLTSRAFAVQTDETPHLVDPQFQSLRTATALLDRMRWKGRKLAPTQPLAWPRVDDRCPPGYPLIVGIPNPISTACIELAISLLAMGQIANPAVQMRQLGDAMTMYFPTIADELPKHVRRLIEPFLRVGSANVAEITL